MKGKAERGSPKAPTRELKQSAMELSNSFKFLKKFIFWCHSMTKKVFRNLNVMTIDSDVL